MATYPLATLACTIDSTGISAPAYADILGSLTASFQSIYGSDIYVDPDSQDGQWLATLSQIINDGNQADVTVFVGYSPTYAQGAALASQVKINGLRKDVASNSTAVVDVVGQVGTSITNGVVEDTSGNLWNLPASVEIPISGTVSVTVTAQQPGTISAAADSISEINTPTRGWQSVTNPLAAAPGAPIESDAALRQRQAASTSLPAQTPFQTIVANVGEISGIGRYKGYQNDTGSPDANGIPGHSIALVVEGGDATTIAQTIEAKKSPGTGTYGTTSIVVLDPSGVPVTIKFFVLSEIEIYLLVDITPQTGYVSTTGTALIKALAAYISAFGIGQSSILSKLDSPANLSGTAATSTSGLTQAQLEALSDTYDVESIYQARGDMTVIGGPYAAGATTINVANAANFANGQAIQITQSDGSMASGTVTGVSGAAVSFTPPIASGKTVVNGALAYVAGNLSVAFNEGGNCAVANITLTS